jgi:hypothetical protein
MTDEILNGRPPKYTNAEDMQKLIDLYFSACRANRLTDSLIASGDYDPQDEDILCTDDRHPTLSGMGLVLDLVRQSLLNYEGDEKFMDTIKKGKARVEAYNEQKLHMPQCTGVIFNLKNNFDWKDKSEQELSGPGGGPIQTKTLLVQGVNSDNQDT